MDGQHTTRGQWRDRLARVKSRIVSDLGLATEWIGYWLASAWWRTWDYITAHPWHTAINVYLYIALALWEFMPSLHETMRVEEAILALIGYIGFVQALRHAKFAYDDNRFQREGGRQTEADEAREIVAEDRWVNRAIGLGSQFIYFCWGVIFCVTGTNNTPLTWPGLAFYWGAIVASLIGAWNGWRSERARNRLRAILPKLNGNGNGKH